MSNANVWAGQVTMMSDMGNDYRIVVRKYCICLGYQEQEDRNKQKNRSWIDIL